MLLFSGWRIAPAVDSLILRCSFTWFLKENRRRLPTPDFLGANVNHAVGESPAVIGRFAERLRRFCAEQFGGQLRMSSWNSHDVFRAFLALVARVQHGFAMVSA